MDKIKARELRKNLTEAERTLWKHLRFRQLGGYKFRRQQPIEQYIVDFVCLEKRLIIELDGGQHSEQVSSDSRRSAWLETQGYQVLRFWNNQVLEETEAVVGVIMEALGCRFDSPHLNPPPQVGRNCRKRPTKEGCVKIFNQKGFSLIIAIVILIIFGILAAMLTSLVTTDSDIAMYQARSGEALYIANAGQQYVMRFGNAQVGTGTISSAGTTVTGAGTSFTTQLQPENKIIAGGQSRTIISIASTTSLTVDTAFAPALPAGTAFSYTPMYPNFSIPPNSIRGGTPQVNLGSGGFTVDPPTVITNNPLNASAATINVVSTTGFPVAGRILIESELIDYTGITGTSFTGATRGVGRSLAVQHNIDSGVYHATALTAGVTNAATTIPVSSTSGFMIPGTIKIDQEFLYCTGTTGGFSGCTRGTQVSQAMAHNAGASAVQITTTITGIVPTGIIGDAKRVLRAQAGIYLDGWGVGNTGTLVRWNGINWDTVTTPVAQNLNSVSTLDTNNDGTADDGWAVGNSNGTRPTVLRWNIPCGGGAPTGTWNNCTTPAFVPAIDLPLNSVYMLSATDGWAVGNRIAITTTGWTFLRWNSPTAGTWNQITVTTAANAQHLNSVSMVSGSDGWAVGNRIGAGTNQWTFLRWTGSWSQFTVTTGIAAQNLNSVFMLSATDGWAVGARRGCTASGPTILRWNGASWACEGGLGVLPDQNLFSIFMVSSTDGWAVGNPGAVASQRPLILHCQGGPPCSWSTIDTSAININQPLNSVYCNSTSDCWAVGNAAGGTSVILHWDGTRWSRYPAPSTTQLNEVFMVRPQNFLRLADWQEVY